MKPLGYITSMSNESAHHDIYGVPHVEFVGLSSRFDQTRYIGMSLLFHRPLMQIPDATEH